METSVTVDPTGVLLVREQEPGQLPHRRTIEPGRMVKGVWQSADLSVEPEEVLKAAEDHWNEGVIRTFRAHQKRTESKATAPVDPLDAPISPRQLRNILKKLGMSDVEINAA